MGFGDTFDQDYADVYRFAYRMLGHREGAEDVVQEAFLRLARKGMEHLAGEPRRRWLFVVARNLCLSGYRQRAKERTVSIEDCPSFPSSTLDPAQVSQQAERAGMVRQAVARLSPDLREVIVLREYEDMSYEQIAEIVKCPIGTVRSRISRAREELRRFLQPLLEETL